MKNPHCTQHLSCHSKVTFWKVFMLFRKDFLGSNGINNLEKDTGSNIYIIPDGKKSLIIMPLRSVSVIASQRNWFFSRWNKSKICLFESSSGKDPLKRHVSKNKFGRQYQNVSNRFSGWRNYGFSSFFHPCIFMFHFCLYVFYIFFPHQEPRLSAC